MAEEKKKTQDFEIGFTPEQFDGIQANDGAGYRRVLFGHFTGKIIDGEIVASTSAKEPHQMIRLTTEIMGTTEDRTKGEIGSSIKNLYGTPTSPKFMQQRFKALCEAIKVKPLPGKKGIMMSQLLGKTYDFTVVWELSDSGKYDENGRKKFYVNDRIKCERIVGAPTPKTINPVADSQKAAKYLDEGQSEGPAAGDRADWDASPEGSTAAASTETEAPGFMPEEQVEADGHEYRAIYKLGGDNAEAAKTALIESGIDPEGPINVEHLTAETAAEYKAKFQPEKPAGKTNGLKPLGGRATGTRQPRA